MAENRGGDRSAAAAANGKRNGRPPKLKIEQRANKGIASEVLAMDGPPDHKRRCKCDVCAPRKKEQQCECTYLESDKEGGKIKIECHFCRTRAEHLICHCEICGWWEPLLSTDRRLRKETRVYLTDRRDGKPAQGVFIGDTRENAPDLDFGNLLMPAGPENQPGTPGKPN